MSEDERYNRQMATLNEIMDDLEVLSKLRQNLSIGAEKDPVKKPKKYKKRTPVKALQAAVNESTDESTDEGDETDEGQEEPAGTVAKRIADGEVEPEEIIECLDKNQEKLDELTEETGGISMRQRRVLQSVKSNNNKLKEITNDTNMAKPTVYSCLASLNKRGLVERSGFGYYEITDKGKKELNP